MSAYGDLIAWDRKRNARPVVIGYDSEDTGCKTAEDGAYTDGPVEL